MPEAHSSTLQDYYIAVKQACNKDQTLSPCLLTTKREHSKALYRHVSRINKIWMKQMKERTQETVESMQATVMISHAICVSMADHRGVCNGWISAVVLYYIIWALKWLYCYLYLKGPVMKLNISSARTERWRVALKSAQIKFVKSFLAK